MTTTDDTALAAGPELDAEVARRVFGWPEDYITSELKYRASFSTDIAAAWLVMENMRKRGKVVSLTVAEMGEAGPNWCSFDSPFSSRHEWQSQQCETMPLAICRAALKALDHAAP